jgi:hypothetical protein
MRTSTRVFLLSASFAAAVGFVACGGATSDKGNLDPTEDQDSSTTGETTPADDSGISIGCKPACTGTQFCSITNVCIEKGTCAGDGDCAAGMKCDATKKCIPGGDCGSQKAGAMAVPPNMMITLDRSCSMTSAVTGGTKWQVAVKAINTMLTKYTAKIRFGLILFPDIEGESCSQGKIPFEPAVGNEPKISTLLTNALKAADPLYPDGPCVTNIDTAIEQATKSTALMDTMRGNYVLLVSDGAQAGCKLAGSDAGTEKMIADLLTKGVKTAVIGFGAGVDGAQLDKFAIAGGMPSPAATKYYKAEDAASLDAALAAIAGAALGCTYKLDKVPDDPTKIFVFFDGTKEVPRDGTNGWTYDAATNTVTFHGTACTSLKTEMVKTLDIVLGCKVAPT